MKTVFEIQRDLIKKDNPVIFDVGAFIGSITLEYYKLFPNAQFFCFEPDISSYAYLLDLKRKDGVTVNCYPLALSNKSGKAKFHHNNSSSTNSLHETDPRGMDYWGNGIETNYIENVDLITIDDFTNENKISNIDILKIDVQGHEYEVLEGARGMLSEHKISVVYTEIILVPTYKEQHTFDDYIRLMKSFGYELVYISNLVIKGVTEAQADYTFIAPEIINK
jgi:FkbM family methyltransferase